MRRIVFTLLVALAMATFWISEAAAQDAETIEKVQKHFDSGATFYEKGEYEKAIDEFQAGYALVPDPIFLYNISLSHGKLGRVNESLAVAELAESMGLGEPDQSQNKARMVALRNVQGARTVAGELSVVARKKAADDQKEAKRVASRPFFTLYGWIGVGTASVGLAGLVGALLIDLSLDGDVEAYVAAASRGDEVEYLRLKDEIESSQMTAQILFFSGAALAAAGTGLIVWDLMRDRPSDQNTPQAIITPTPDGGAVSIFGRW